MDPLTVVECFNLKENRGESTGLPRDRAVCDSGVDSSLGEIRVKGSRRSFWGKTGFQGAVFLIQAWSKGKLSAMRGRGILNRWVAEGCSLANHIFPIEIRSLDCNSCSLWNVPRQCKDNAPLRASLARRYTYVLCNYASSLLRLALKREVYRSFLSSTFKDHLCFRSAVFFF